MGRKRFRLGHDHGGRVTVRTVADIAGVSIASASRVLNGLGGSPELSARVRSAAERVGYVPNAIARSLQAQRTGLIGIAVPDIGNPIFIQMVRQAERVISDSGRQLLLHATKGDAAGEVELLRGLARRYVDGLILSTIKVTEAHHAILSQVAVPVVVTGQLLGDVPVDNVWADNTAGVQLAIEHFVQSGRRRIAFVNGPLDTIPGSVRDVAYRSSVAAAGLAVDDDLIENGDFTFAAGLDGTRRLLDRVRPDAILCGNDLIAAGTLHALLASGIRVPTEVAIIGMDNTALAELTFPRLTSVDLGGGERGRMAARMLLDRLETPDLPPRHESIVPFLAVRDTTVPNGDL
ncbi:LacI family transcriptional regulator [Allocatelliglobosispora scoriae]|uniref:LacI family transcriptional regulator n=1 Tax=Allocatelliglobosispora scoriae TaxID=643052 RepID=A0A841BSR8_9ACTN|nr:LacI family DNA-binding transcriptional regulator [Allocatelliglobosispora scoriae]MBB5869782.1 LacI family transcriptional regulator [Allocatelliglobosispora scoriae]